MTTEQRKGTSFILTAAEDGKRKKMVEIDRVSEISLCSGRATQLNVNDSEYDFSLWFQMEDLIEVNSLGCIKLFEMAQGQQCVVCVY